MRNPILPTDLGPLFCLLDEAQFNWLIKAVTGEDQLEGGIGPVVAAKEAKVSWSIEQRVITTALHQGRKPER